MKNMKLLLFVLLFYTTALSALTLKEKFTHAHPGDYIVTEQSKNYSLLFVRSINEDSIILEELSVPSHLINLNDTNWQTWVMSRAPGHTSWVSYEIDFQNNKLKESFSYTQNGWLFLQDSDYLLAKLLSLKLEKVHEIDRRRIGPAPSSGERDTRAVWNPSLVIEGKKINKPKSEVWHGKWPDDGTLLAGCGIELYFDSNRPSFPFPYWIEIQSSHYALKVRTIDSGAGLSSPMPLLPYKSPVFIGKPQKKADLLQFLLKTPSYYQKLNLFVVDLTALDRTPLFIPTTRKNLSNLGEILLEVNEKDLYPILKSGHSYRWIVIAEEGSNGYAEIEQPFLWNQ